MRRLIARSFMTLALAIVLFAALASVATACPTCGDALGHQDAAHNGVAKGFYYSILFMMGMPYLLLMTFCGGMYWKVRRARGARALQQDPAQPAQASRHLAGQDVAESPAASRIESREPVEV